MTTQYYRNDKNKILFLLIPFFNPNIIGALPSLSWLYNIFLVWKCISIIIGINLSLRIFKHFSKHSYISVFPILLFSIFTISTYLNNGDLLHCLFYLLGIYSIVSIVLYYGIERNNFGGVFSSMYKYFLFLLVLNLFTMIVNPANEGYWLLASKNNHIYFILPCLFFSACIYGSLRKMILPIAISIITVVIGKSSTSLFAIFFVFFYYFATRYKVFRIAASLKVVFLVSILVSASFIIMNNIAYLDYVIAYFEKEDTFGRFIIWEHAIVYISRQPILGYGLETSEVMWMNIGNSHCHNEYLDVAYMGGFAGFAVFVLYLFKSFSTKLESNKLCYLLAAVLSSYAIEFLMEGKRADLAFYLLTFIYPFVVDNKLKQLKNDTLQ